MLLNNFLYNRSVIQNEYFKNISEFYELIPKKTIHDFSENPYETEEYIEEIKKIKLGGGEDLDDGGLDDGDLDDGDLDDGDLDDGEIKRITLEECNVELNEIEEKLDGLKDELKTEKEEKDELKDELKTEKEEKDELKDELKTEKEEKEEEKEEEKKDDKIIEDIQKIKKALKYIGAKKGGENGGDDKHSEKEVIFDNLTKEGGNTEDKDVKNVVVSFF